MDPKTVLTEFKTFIMKGNVVDLAVGVVIGQAFGKVVDSVVKDLITPIPGRLFGQTDFSAIQLFGIGVGNFLNALLAFVMLAAVVFFLVVKPMNALMAIARRKAETQPAAPPPLPEDVRLLMEIRDLLKNEARRADAARSSGPDNAVQV
jgi:large conductance mechanosensitive channel